MNKYFQSIVFFLFISCGGEEKSNGFTNNNNPVGKKGTQNQQQAGSKTVPNQEVTNTDIKVPGARVTVLCQCANGVFVRGSGDDQTSAQENAKSKCSVKTLAVKNCSSI